MFFISRFETNLGTGAVMATDLGICKVMLPHDGLEEGLDVHMAADLKASPLTEQVAEMLKRYFKGEEQHFDSVTVDLDGLSAFRARILMLIRAIPFGDTRSYGEVAAMAGAPRAARAIGGAMAANPVPIIIPCHRVIAADGRLTGFTAPGGLKLKKLILQMERVEFIGAHVARKKEGYKQ